MQISPVTNISIQRQSTFQKKSNTNDPVKLGDDNPISRRGEAMNLIKTTFVGGLVLGGRLLLELVSDGDFVIDTVGDYSKRIANSTNKKEIDKLQQELEHQKKYAKSKKLMHGIGAFVALIATGLCGFAILYTAFNAPKIAYNSKVNAFTKSKEMDVYIKANDAEKELYTQLDEKAKNSTPEEKEKLKTQYMQMVNAKNQVPDFVQLKR